MNTLLPGAAIQRLKDPAINRLVVGLSGGVDSISLLHAVAKLDPGPPVTAIHIDHGLQDDSTKFASVSRRHCQELGVRLRVIPVDVDPAGSLETRAREARYAAIEACLTPGDLLLLAHHADDQVETLLFRLFRGSRVPGLEGMPAERTIGRARLFRPLLSVPRAEILQWAREQDLTWVEDPTNQDLTPDRNYIRHRVLPVIRERWPGAEASLLRSLAGDQRAREALHDRHKQWLESLQSETGAIEIGALSALAPADICELLTAWMLDAGAPLPTGKMLTAVAEAIAESRPVNAADACIELRQHGGELHLLRPLPSEESLSLPLETGDLQVPGGLIANNLSEGKGLKQGRYTLRTRQGGESIRVRHLRSLKNICQETGIPGWLRQRLPLVYCDEELVAICALPGWGIPMLVADGWEASGSDPGFEISLHLDDRW